MNHPRAGVTPPVDITGLLLAGGLGRRMGGADKGLLAHGGRPLAAWVLARLAPQVRGVLINANRNAQTWAAFGYPLIADELSGFVGPLAGLHAGLAASPTPWLACVPCDAPQLPVDLVARLAQAAAAADAPLSVACAGGRMQPVFALVHRDLRDALAAYLAAGGRRAGEWVCAQRHAVADFADADAFANVNTPGELAPTP